MANLSRASVLIESFKQIAIDKRSEKKTVFNVKRQITETIYSIDPKNFLHGYALDILCAEELSLDGYPMLFSRIVDNLASNSILHGFEGRGNGVITIKAEIEGKDFILDYHDDGKGIPQDQLEKIFDPFYTTKRNKGGIGLGLCIVYNIVRYNFGGTIQCESSPGNGTRFIIRFPSEQE